MFIKIFKSVNALFLITFLCAIPFISSQASAFDNYGNVTNTLNGSWNNYGSVSTANADQHGMYADHSEYSVNKASGSIVTQGARACGIYNYDGLVQNDGTITTYGTDAHGLYSRKNHPFEPAKIYQGGDITTYGVGAHGVYARNVSAGVLDAYISGSVAAYGGAFTYAVFAYRSNIHLRSGARILSGTLYADDMGTGNLYLEDSGTVDFAIGGAWDNLYKAQAGGWNFETSAVFFRINFDGGTLGLASGKRLRAGTYSQAAGTTLSVVLDDSGLVPVQIGGSANVAGTLVVDATYNILTGSRVIISAAGGVGNFDSVISKNPHMSLATSRVGNNIVLANAAYTPKWDNSALSLTSTMMSNMVFLQLPGLRSQQIMTSSKEQEPVMVASAGPMYDLIPKSSADKRYAVYMQPIYSTSTRDPFNGAPGYRASTTGFEVGADTYISDNLLLGVFAGYASADVNFNGVVFAENDSEKQKLFTVGGYGGYRADNWLFSDTLNFIYSKNNSKRNAGLGETAKGDYDTQLLSNQFLASYILPLRDSWKLATELGLNTRYLNRGAFSETDATNALRYSKFQEFFAESVMGLSLRKSFEYDEVRLIPYARVAWSHALLGNDISVRQTLGSSTALVTQRNDNDFLNLGLGVSVRKGDTMLSLIYNGEASEHSRSHGLTANLRYEF